MVRAMTEQDPKLDGDVRAGDDESSLNTAGITRRRLIRPWRRSAAPRDSEESEPTENGLTNTPDDEHTNGRQGGGSSAYKPVEQEDMARTPEAPITLDYSKLIDESPIVPKSDFEVGAPEELGEPAESEPMADLSKPDTLPDEVRAVIDSAP
jgi:hypothetical protein